MGKIGQNPKIWQLWRPVAPQRYVVEKSWPDFGNSLALGLQRGVMWTFSKMSFRIHRRDTEVRFVAKFGENQPLRSCRKVAWITTHKKTRAPRDSSQPPFCSKWDDRAQNSLNVITPWHVHVYWIWSGSAAFCRTYSGKIDFSAQKVNTLGFQPTISTVSVIRVYSNTVMGACAWLIFQPKKSIH